MTPPDLRILALTDVKRLPFRVQDEFDHWRIWKARDAVVAMVRKRVPDLASKFPAVEPYVERLEAAETEEIIFQGLYAVGEVVDVYRAQIGLHSDYIVLIMSSHINPWGVLEFQRDFANPAAQVTEAAALLWRLCAENGVDVAELLKKIKDPLMDTLNEYYTVHPLPKETP